MVARSSPSSADGADHCGRCSWNSCSASGTVRPPRRLRRVVRVAKGPRGGLERVPARFQAIPRAGGHRDWSPASRFPWGDTAMAKITYVHPDGTSSVVDVEPGNSIMRGAKLAGVEG